VYGYSKDHLECLNKKKSELQFKKSSMLKQNCTINFCSPIHCAVVNSNLELLAYILKHISDFNVGDSHGRKPIHYAAAL
jgi:ankyrin repeat protein